MADDRIAEPGGPAYVVKNRVQAADQAIHGWYRFVLGYPPHLVRQYLEALDADLARDWVFDPFCGTATTPVEARLQGFRTISVEANPICVLAARVKLAWDVSIDEAEQALAGALNSAVACLESVSVGAHPAGDWQQPLFDCADVLAEPSAVHAAFHPIDLRGMLPAGARKVIPRGFISEKPLLRVLALRRAIESGEMPSPVRDLLTLALANVIVTAAGNVGFGPEVYRLPPKDDADVLGAFADTVGAMIADLRALAGESPPPHPEVRLYEDDARELSCLARSPAIGTVITSPPYPNEKDYTRSTRLESVLLGLLGSRDDIRRIKARLLRSNTRTVFAADDDDRFAADVQSVMAVAEAIERRRLELGKTSGFERLYHRVTRLYFGGMYRHFAALIPHLRRGAKCAYVVGDQMSFFRIHIRTAKLLADVAIKAGFAVDGIDLWRTRRSTATGVDLQENVLILRKP